MYYRRLRFLKYAESPARSRSHVRASGARVSVGCPWVSEGKRGVASAREERPLNEVFEKARGGGRVRPFSSRVAATRGSCEMLIRFFFSLSSGPFFRNKTPPPSPDKVSTFTSHTFRLVSTVNTRVDDGGAECPYTNDVILFFEKPPSVRPYNNNYCFTAWRGRSAGIERGTRQIMPFLVFRRSERMANDKYARMCICQTVYAREGWHARVQLTRFQTQQCPRGITKNT